MIVNGILTYVAPSGGIGFSGLTAPPQAAPVDTTPVVISNLAFNTASGPVANQSTTTVTWTTNKLANSVVDYGTTQSYGTTITSSSLSTSHTVLITGLAATNLSTTTYHFRISSTDASSNQSASSDQSFITLYSCTQYVDAISGNDANTGSSTDQAKKTLGAVSAVSNGSTICLKRGSTFMDTLFVGIPGTARNNITVRDYGTSTSAMPLIDGGVTIPASAWSLAPNTTKVYQATVIGPGTSTTTPYGLYNDTTGLWINVFECASAPCTPPGRGGNDNFLSNQTSTSSVNSTKLSYYIPGMTSVSDPTTASSFTIYLQPGDGLNPATNGYTYSYTYRFFGLQLSGSGDTVMNISVKKGARLSGSIVQNSDGGSGTFTNVQSDQGGKHNLICSSGCTVSNSSFADEYYPFSGNMLVGFDGTGQNLGMTVTDTQFLQGTSTSGNAVSAIFAHAGSGNFGPFAMTGGLVKNLNGFDLSGVGGAFTSMNISGLFCHNVSGCVQGSVGTNIIANVGSVISAAFGGNNYLYQTGSDSSTSMIASSTYCGPTTHGVIYDSSNSAAITVASSTFYINGTSNSAGIYNVGTSNTLTVASTTIDGSVGFSYWLLSNQATSTSPYIADYNAYVFPNIEQAQVGGTTYFNNFAAWKSASGQDAHTVTTGNGLSACTVPTGD